jgi:hypothetical protein
MFLINRERCILCKQEREAHSFGERWASENVANAAHHAEGAAPAAQHEDRIVAREVEKRTFLHRHGVRGR